MAETELTESDVRQLLIAVGVSPPDAEGSLDSSFEELGMDSLALLEIAGRLLDRFGITVEEELTPQETPAGIRQLVNLRLTGDMA
ncbi:MULTISPECIES: acyl carrier protein [unclassified Streptomyces]|uniref:acyl carrier protein n=1 Tax=unclassified Streptomyces TaxID=2593676 RepID=UPI00381A9416